MKLKKTATDTFHMIQEAYEKEIMSCEMVFMHQKKFQNGRKDVEDYHCAERLSTSQTKENLVKVYKLLNMKRCLSITINYY